jgi:hypothetical protein
MRYFRDLNLDAHLFLYKNEYEHFKPENDTYHIDKYRPYIHKLSVSNSGIGLLLADIKKIKEELREFDFFIGYGMAPALFRRLNYTLDMFIPYGDRIELTLHKKIRPNNFIKYPVRFWTINEQIKGIKYNTTKVIASGVRKVTQDAIKRLGIEDKFIRKYLIMVYNREEPTKKPDSRYIEPMLNRDIVVFSHIRHHWKDLVEDYEKAEGGVKGVDKLIRGYADFVLKNPDINPILVLFEYGKDVDASKDLIVELGIEDRVVWYPLMPRREILQLIDYSDIVVNSLTAWMWGGVGFEGLSRGKVIMQNIVQSDEEYKNMMGHPLPFIMRANSPEDVEKHFNKFIKNRSFYKKRGEENREWFDKYAGIGLAKDYMNIAQKLYLEKNGVVTE